MPVNATHGRSARSVVVFVLRDALRPGWLPVIAAGRVMDHVHGDLGDLQRAKGRLLAATADRPAMSAIQARALKALNVAIAEVEEMDRRS